MGHGRPTYGTTLVDVSTKDLLRSDDTEKIVTIVTHIGTQITYR